MNKLVNALYFIICFYILCGSIGGINLTRDFYNSLGEGLSLENISYFNLSKTLIYFVLACYLTLHFYFFSKTVNKLNEDSFFKLENALSFKKIGQAITRFVLISFSVRIIFTAIEASDAELAQLPPKFVSYLFLMIIALFLLIIAHLIRNGHGLKKENDLTI